MTHIPDFDLFQSPLAGTNLIEASAGTGKTYAITGLVLRLVLERTLPISEILVVTFTEAATSELKDRIRKRLREALECLTGAGAQDELLEKLLQNLTDRAAAKRRLTLALNDFDQASIFTIHGFCMRVLHDHAFESGMLLDTELVTDQEKFVREIVHDFWREHCYHASPLFFNYAVSHQFNRDRLRALVSNHIANPYLRIVPESGIPDCREMEQNYQFHFGKVQEAWTSDREEVEALLATADALNRAKYNKASIPGWVQAMDVFLSGDGRDCTPFEKFEKFTASHIQSAVKKGGTPPSHPFFLLCDHLDLARQQLTECFDQCLLGLRNEFIRTVRSELAARKQNKNMIYYDDLLLLLDRALRGRGADSLAAIVREKFKAALIDEFQDTDAIQYAIFEKIFGGGKSTLFLIGDPKQAIYGFRGADIFTYMDAARRAALRFTLTENWRSETGLTEAVNTVFAHPCLPFVYPEIGFKPAQPAAKKQHEALQVAGGREPPLQIWLVDTERISEGKPITKTNAREVIPGAVAGEISRLLMLARNGRAVIGDRPLREGDIAVLVRRNAEAQLVRQALTELGIHSVLYNIGHLFDTPEAMEVERILTSIADPSDERFLKIALATEMLGATGEMLDQLTRDEAAWEEWLVRFGEYHDLWNRNGFFRMFRHLLSREAVLPRLMSLLDGERRCTNILHLSEVLHQASVENNLNMFGLVKWLAAQRDSGTPRLEEHQLRLESDENAVKLVTIHKSKGLEYPVVFCPFIGDGSRLSRRDEPITFHDEANEMRLTLDLGSSRRDESAKLAEKEQLAENLRLLYVAMTRAKHRCYLVWGRFKDAETSAPAYLFHQPRSGEPERLPDAVAARFPTLDDEGLRIDLREVQAGTNGLIDVRDMPLERGTVRLPPEAETIALECRPFSGSIPRDWGIASFSSVIGSQPRTLESTDRDDALAPATTIEEHLAEPLPAGLVAPDLHHLEGQSQELRTPPLPPFEEGRVGGFNVDMFDFPKGAPAGIFLHELFENLDFTLQDKAAITELIEDKLKAHGFESFWTSAVYDMIKKVLEVPLDSLDGTFSLSQVPKVDRLSELGFYFPLRRLSGSRLRDVFSCCLKDRSKGFSGLSTGTPQRPEPPTIQESPFSKERHGEFERFPSGMGRLNFKPLEGFMRGFIDLVFRFRERFYIVDWKSNFLGGRTEDYRQASLQKAMEEGFYHLQYHLYTVAVHKYLETRVPAYRYESHFGGVFYLFLRGIDPAKGGDYGVYRHRPPAADIEALCSTLIGPVEP